MEKIFGISNSSSLASYLQRIDWVNVIDEALIHDHHVIIYGGTKQGKTLLINNYKIKIPYHDICRLSSSTKMDKLSREILKKVSVFNDHIPGNVDSVETLEDARLYFKMHKFPNETFYVVLENYHKFDSKAEKNKFLEQIRNSMEGDYKIIFIIVGILQNEDVTFIINDELSGRVACIIVDPWHVDDLENVISKGLNHLSLEIEDRTKDIIIEKSFGTVGILQQIMDKLLNDHLPNVKYDKVLKFKSIEHQSKIFEQTVLSEVGAVGRAFISLLFNSTSIQRLSGHSVLKKFAFYLLDNWKDWINNPKNTELNIIDVEDFMYFLYGNRSYEQTNACQLFYDALSKELKNIEKQNDYGRYIKILNNSNKIEIINKYLLFYLIYNIDEIADGVLIFRNSRKK